MVLKGTRRTEGGSYHQPKVFVRRVLLVCLLSEKSRSVHSVYHSEEVQHEYLHRIVPFPLTLSEELSLHLSKIFQNTLISITTSVKTFYMGRCLFNKGAET